MKSKVNLHDFSRINDAFIEIILSGSFAFLFNRIDFNNLYGYIYVIAQKTSLSMDSIVEKLEDVLFHLSIIDDKDSGIEVFNGVFASMGINSIQNLELALEKIAKHWDKLSDEQKTAIATTFSGDNFEIFNVLMKYGAEAKKYTNEVKAFSEKLESYCERVRVKPR